MMRFLKKSPPTKKLETIKAHAVPVACAFFVEGVALSARCATIKVD